MGEFEQSIKTNSIGAALLCAVGSNENNNHVNTTSPALISIAGVPLIEFQIGQLVKNGINKIFVEIEVLPGALVAMADRAQAAGASVVFVRSPAELGGKIEKGQFLFILSEGVYIDDNLLSEIVSQNSAFIVTVDGRDENAVFERIDLNSYWTGIAMLGAASVESVASLPAEWSISSSLLRRALQDSVVHRPMKQDVVVAGKLSKISSVQDANILTKNLLQAQSAEVNGIIEKLLFAPIAAWIAPKIWKLAPGKLSLSIFAWLSLIATMASALFGNSSTASIVALVSIFSFQLSRLLQGSGGRGVLGFDDSDIALLLLSIAFLAVFWNWTEGAAENIFIGLMVSALTFLALQIAKPGWSRYLLCSPGLLAILTLIFTGIGWLPLGFMLVALIQVGMLIYISWTDRSLIRG